MTKSTAYGSLGPYVLKNEKGQIMENIWQFSKIYSSVPAVREIYSRYQPIVIWERGAEQHVTTEGEILPAYWKWREDGMAAIYPIRYPVGRAARSSCLYALKEKGGQPLSYIAARKAIYLPIYIDLVRERAQYKQLKTMLAQGERLLIVEIDGPHEESLAYYQEKYGVQANFIVNDTILASKENLNIMLEDSKHAFGHAYCLSMALLGFS